jgi:hypothetical protein
MTRQVQRSRTSMTTDLPYTCIQASQSHGCLMSPSTRTAGGIWAGYKTAGYTTEAATQRFSPTTQLEVRRGLPDKQDLRVAHVAHGQRVVHERQDPQD